MPQILKFNRLMEGNLAKMYLQSRDIVLYMSLCIGKSFTNNYIVSVGLWDTWLLVLSSFRS